MKAKKQVLTIRQMQNLIQLGIDVSQASMCWIKNTDGDELENKYMLSVHDEWCYEMSCLSPIPTFSIIDILSLLPDRINDFSLRINVTQKWIEYASVIDGCLVHNGLMEFGETILDAAYKMLVSVTKNRSK